MNFCENSSLLYLPALRGVGGTDAAGYKPHDVFAEQKPAKDGCVHKQQRDLCIAQISSFNSVQGCTLLNIWHGCQFLNQRNTKNFSVREKAFCG